MPLAIGRKGFSNEINSCLISRLSFSVLLGYHFKARTGHKGFSELALSLAKLWKENRLWGEGKSWDMYSILGNMQVSLFEDVRPQATATRKVVFLARSSILSLDRGSNSSEARSCSTRGRFHYGSNTLTGGLCENMPLIRAESDGLQETAIPSPKARWTAAMAVL